MVKHKVSISLDEEIVKSVEKIAKERHLNFSTAINQLLWESLKELKGGK